MNGKVEIDVLHAQQGHSKISFDCDNPEAMELAKKQIEDMMKLGYTIFIETETGVKRVTRFDKKHCTYLIGSNKVPAKDSQATAVAPSAGGCLVTVR